jgi:aspartate carbamoyltransferase regulatory subunit
MLNVSGLNEGIVLDHIQAGMSTKIFEYLGLGKLDCQVAMIRNAKSSKMGRKDIIKIEGGLDMVDLDVLGFLDHNITINIIKDGKIAEKRSLRLPKRLTNILYCKNPRCITTIERGLPHVFLLTSEEPLTYRCMYCDEAAAGK